MKVSSMKISNLQQALVMPMIVSLLLSGVPLPAASPAIGTVMTNGSFRMNNMTLRGNATLFEGSTLETAGTPSSVELASGARLTLGADSRGQIFGDHLVLERGQGDMAKTVGVRLQARGLTVQPETGDSTGRVRLAGANKVQVEVLKGSFRILNSNGLLVAKLIPGSAMAFEPQATSTLTRISGRLSVKAGGHMVMTDETTHVTMEVVGKDGVVSKDLEKLAGQRVSINGALDPAAAPVSDASQLVRVSNVTLLAQAGAAPAGSASGASGTAGGSAAGGSTAGGTGAGGAAAGGAAAGGTAAGATALGVGLTTVAIVGGVAAAAVVGGLAASGAIGGSSTPISR